MLLIGLFLVGAKEFFKQQFQQSRQLVLLAATILPLIIFSLFSYKHGKYLLPIYPLIAILLAIKLAEIFDAATEAKKKIIVIIALLLPIGSAIFYTLLEPKVFAYRVAVFPTFSAWVPTIKQTDLYAYQKIDSRLVYYANRPIKILDKNKLEQAKSMHRSFLLLVESDNLSALRLEADCTIKEFSPYLKKNKSLTVFGFGRVCKLG
jgi:hypothetical protein